MKSSFSIFIVFLLLVTGCSSWKTTLISEGNPNDAIRNAITDFMNTCYLRNRDSVFIINTYINNEEILGISIIGDDNNKVFPGPNDKIGTMSKYFPDNYVLKDGKLFYWRSDSTANYITQDIVSVLTRYNHIDSMNVDSIIGIPHAIDEKKKAADYYFCKNNLIIYKKVVAKKAMGWYVPPKLKCGSLSQRSKLK